MYINKAILFGNLTRDPELRALPSGQNVCSFSVATNRTYKDRDGKKQEQTDFHNVAQYLKKGSSVYVEGRIQTRSWDDKGSGEKKYRTEIVGETIQFGPRSSGNGGGSRREENDMEMPVSSGASSSGIDYPKDDINPDDIPF